MSRQSDLTTAADQVAARLKDLTANPKPSYEIAGRKVLWADYFRELTQALKELQALETASDGPFEVRSQAVT